VLTGLHALNAPKGSTVNIDEPATLHGPGRLSGNVGAHGPAHDAAKRKKNLSSTAGGGGQITGEGSV
jgi:hypothetical protein